MYNNKKFSNKKLGRIAFNTGFLENDQKWFYNRNFREIIFNLAEIDPDNLVKKKKIPKDFQIKIKFNRICECNNRASPINICEHCGQFINKELTCWLDIQTILDVIRCVIIESQSY